MVKALEQQMRDEFPVGTRVRWTHTFDRQNQPVKREGVVKDYSYGPTILVEMRAGGAKHRVPAHQAELVEAAPGVLGTPNDQPNGGA